MRRELAENIDGVESIRICAEHQKRMCVCTHGTELINISLLTISRRVSDQFRPQCRW